MTVSNSIDLIGDAPLFEGLDADVLRELRGAAEQRLVAKGRVLFRQGDAASELYLVAQGRIRASELTADGTEVLLRFLEPGQMLGGMAALEGTTYPLTAIAERNTTMLVWSRASIDPLIDRYPRLARNLMRLMVRRIGELQQRVVERATERVEQRVARAVLRLAGQAGRRTSDGVLLDLPLSRQDLAAMTGTTLFTVSRVLSRWNAQGLLKSSRQSLTLRQPHKLVAIADGLPLPTKPEPGAADPVDDPRRR